MTDYIAYGRVRDFRIQLGGQWTLQEFQEYSHSFNQIYSLINYIDRLDDGQVSATADGKLLGSFPWRGGYSTVNFFRKLQSKLPVNYMPKVKSIECHSPGFLDLFVYLPTMLALSVMVAAFLKNANQITDSVKNMYQALHDMKLMKIEAKRKELELSQEQLEFLDQSTSKLERLLGIPKSHLLDQFLPNKLAKLKMEFSIYRIIKRLASYEMDGKARISQELGRGDRKESE